MDKLKKVNKPLSKSYNVLFVLLITLLCLGKAEAQEYLLTVEVIDELSQEPLESAEISIEPCACGGITNRQGFFYINLPKDTYTVSVNYIGFKSDVNTVELNAKHKIKVVLIEEQEQLSEVIVHAKKINDNLELPQMGALQLQTQELKKIPSGLGEADILRSMTLLAGVNNSGEISNGLSVRGGALDQNLLLLDNAPVFNPTHLFGLFSVFTPDVISSVDLYRANIPARYGGRITSVLDIKVKNPYVDKFKLSGGVGLVSSRLSIETPIIKDKLMIAIGGRAGLTDFLLPLVSERLKDTKANFYDSTMKLLYLPTKNDQLTFTGFYSKDYYQLDLITKIQNINAKNNQYDFQTLNGTVNWRHSFNDESNLRTFLVMSDYAPKTIFPEVDNANEIEFKSRINYLSFASEYTKEVSSKFDYYVGTQINKYRISPGELNPGNTNSVAAVNLEKENSYEFSGYGNINYNPSNSLSLSAGLRLSHYVLIGPYKQAQINELTGQLQNVFEFEKGAGVKTYNGLEPRLGLNLKLNETTSIKASYARLNQYLQNVYNSTTPLPTSRWKTSDPFIKPQISDAYGLGIYKNTADNLVEFGIEGYYRDSKNNLTYKPGADFFLEEFLERDVIQGQGKAYGVEFSVKKSSGKVNGWLNYTWSKSLLNSDNENLADRINNNKWYVSDFDRPHVVNSTINFEGDKYNIWSFNFTGQTGRPYTVANSVFKLDDIDVPIFIERNNARLRPYHRLDFSWTVKYGEKVNKRWVGDWTFTIYNVYSRRNPFNIYYAQRQPDVDADVFLGSPLGSYELSILNSPLFALTYNFVFQ
ncbi:TonB-dependent receptor [Maribacter hydrothermalis]|uniref:TonB-dependent receptor n=1 Tax=Maribacter hydrothermalis TaxID=1836467 RepID=A0A1B7ZFE6_9FLAO|nr:TonB-dependent receptor [Maribacter hydrothermalis]APQ17811.1 TonB-dependent receptor [Maribacter hydrothermalis]OBR42285.1 TonB-dependent receptor [Maribacter hydrothermalis]